MLETALPHTLLKVMKLIWGRTEQKRVKFPRGQDWEGQRCSHVYTQPWVTCVFPGSPGWFLLKIKGKLLLGMNWVDLPQNVS